MDANPLQAFVSVMAVFILWLAIAVTIGLGIVIVMRHALGYRRPEDAVALGVLKERFARGEVDEAEFERARRAIER